MEEIDHILFNCLKARIKSHILHVFREKTDKACYEVNFLDSGTFPHLVSKRHPSTHYNNVIHNALIFHKVFTKN